MLNLYKFFNRLITGAFEFFHGNVRGYSRARIISTVEVEHKGSLYNLSVEDDETYVVGGLLVHNCRSTTTASLTPDSGIDFGADATRSAQFGPVSADTQYYDWLDNQTDAYQLDTLGPTGYKVFKDKGPEWYRKNSITPTFAPIGVKELEKKAQLQLDD